MEDVLPSAASEFEKTAEDGAIYRIYKIGSVEAAGHLCPTSTNIPILATRHPENPKNTFQAQSHESGRS